jgi:putative phosphoesterase
MRIAVIADTHGKLPDHVAEDIRAADEIWHLGDFTDAEMVARIVKLGRPFYGILGNRDDGIDLPETLRLERGGKSFLLVHEPPKRPGGADFLLHGHTHVPRDEMVGATRVLNPGTIGKPNHGAPPSYAWLEIDAGDGSIAWRIVPVKAESAPRSSARSGAPSRGASSRRSRRH